MARHKDANWDLSTPPGLDGAAVSVLMDIRDELKESRRVQREIADGINSIRHFFHSLGQERIKLLVREHHRKTDLARKRRLRYQARRRRELAAR